MIPSLFENYWTMDPLGWTGWPMRSRYGRARPYPALNVYGNDEKIVITSEIPGITPEDLDITTEGRALTIKGRRETEELSEDECYTCRERGFGEFERSLTLPYEVEADKVDAHYENGLLVLTLPRSEKEKPRKIEIKKSA